MNQYLVGKNIIGKNIFISCRKSTWQVYLTNMSQCIFKMRPLSSFSSDYLFDLNFGRFKWIKCCNIYYPLNFWTILNPYKRFNWCEWKLHPHIWNLDEICVFHFLLCYPCDCNQYFAATSNESLWVEAIADRLGNK